MKCTSAIPLQSRAQAAATLLIGYSAPLYTLPVYSRKHSEARCAYCLLVLAVWTLMQVLPAPVACMFPPLVLAASNTIVDDDAIAAYTSPYILHVVAIMLFIRLGHSFGLFDRAAMVVIRLKGTRVRSLMFVFSGLSLLAALFLDNGVTTLLMAALIERATKALQDSTIQAHQKKATHGLSRNRRKTLEDLLMRGTEHTDVTSCHSPGLQQLDQQYSAAPCDEPANDDNAATQACDPYCAKHYPSLTPIVKTTIKPSLASNSKFRVYEANEPPRRISIMERGHVVLPGISSPTPPRVSVEKVLLVSMAHGQKTPGAFDSFLLLERRYTLLHRDLLLGAVMVAVIGSIFSPRGNTANVLLFSYLQMRFSHFVLHITSWVLVIFPVVGCGLLACLSVMYFAIVRHQDAEEDENARLEILKIIEKQSEGLGTLTPVERLVIVAFILAATLWLAIHVIAFFDNDGRFAILSDHETLALDYLLVALLSSAASQWPVGRTEASAAASGASSALDWRTLVASILWGPLIIYGSVSCMGRALQVSGAVYWIQALLNEFNLFPPTMIQIVLTVLSCVFTEFVSIDVAVATLLPIVVDLALMIPCNPLYFAIPVAVASSTTLVLPTAAMPIAILDDVLPPCRREMLIQGTVLKVVTLTSLIISMNTVGETLFSWSELPSWAQQQPAPNASSVVAIRQLLWGL
ncbi:solute carrier family 13 member 4 [Rhipicephalus sanguineus]|uniref:solute carrier family 13 member 4 n=1 Tax=Rhipicephalus sanguineus TaxID=34632 RepID=UPI001895000A|nr:solute carrier family 13 member 4 [Rhipicephalus sanguineus]